MEKARKMEKALSQLIASIVDESSDDEDPRLEYENFLDEAIQTLEGLQIIKQKNEISVPEDFLCPISKELMIDPVSISTGHTFDRNSIQQLLDMGNAICPKSGQPIQNLRLIPNNMIKSVITERCNNHGVQYPTTLPCELTQDADEGIRGESSSQVNRRRSLNY